MLSNIAFGIITGLLFISLVLLFCVLLVKLHIHKIKNYTRMIYEKDLDFQKSLNMAIIETQEQVLNNISRDLHDDAGQQLTAINFQLENLKFDSPELSQSLEPVRTSVTNLSQSIRSISHSLNNQLLTKQDLFRAISAEAERLQKNLPIAISVCAQESPKKGFNTNEKIVIYRIFQEIINNILKHAKATQISITLHTAPHFEMIIHDNGKGFDYERTKNEGLSLGLSNMIHRAEIIDYTISIESEPKKGTTVKLSEKAT